MKALLYEGPENIRVVELPKPVPKPDEVLVKIRACGICGSDVHGYMGTTGRRIAPMVMGHEFSGEIESLGSDISEAYTVGNRVTVQPVNFCGKCEQCTEGYTNLCTDKRFYGVMSVNGAFQEYLCVPEKLLYKLPDNISFEEGALIEAMAVSYCGVKKAGVLTGKNVLIVGGGAIGQLALIAAKEQNPKTIILSDFSETRLQTAKSLGADYLINPKDKSNFRAEIQELLDGDLADVAIEAVGVSSAVAEAISALKPRGTCVWVGNSEKFVEIDMQAVVTQELKVFGTYIYTAGEFAETIDFIRNHHIDFRRLITESIPIERAPELFKSLAHDTEKYMKVVVSFM